MPARLSESYAGLERKVAERTHQLELANQAKSRFLRAASHDLRQPLHALGLFVAQFAQRAVRHPLPQHRLRNPFERLAAQDTRGENHPRPGVQIGSALAIAFVARPVDDLEVLIVARNDRSIPGQSRQGTIIVPARQGSQRPAGRGGGVGCRQNGGDCDRDATNRHAVSPIITAMRWPDRTSPALPHRQR